MRQVGGWGNVLGVWDGNAIKLCCDDQLIVINIIKFIRKDFKNPCSSEYLNK